VVSGVLEKVMMVAVGLAIQEQIVLAKEIFLLLMNMPLMISIKLMIGNKVVSLILSLIQLLLFMVWL